MKKDFEIKLINSKNKTWISEVDEIRILLGAPHNPTLFPPHFLKSVFPKLGGKVILIKNQNKNMAVGFLFPSSKKNNLHEFTLRFHKIDEQFIFNQEHVRDEICVLIGKCRLVYYFPKQEHLFKKTSFNFNGNEIGNPDKIESEKIRELQKSIWGYTENEQDFLYPTDIHSFNFQTGLSLVIRKQGDIVGFLFGFYKFDYSPIPEVFREKYETSFRIESQLLGVVPMFRGKGLGFLLKKAQATQATEQGIGIINWTFDPLQLRNAILNFCELGGIAFQCYQNYYQFHNELNQVSASRFGVTWLIKTQRVKEALKINQRNIIDLLENSSIKIVNDGINGFDLNVQSEKIAIEIPKNWTRLQKEQLKLANTWREITDTLFLQYIGYENGKYIVTGVGKKADKYYLIAEQANQKFLEKLTY